MRHRCGPFRNGMPHRHKPTLWQLVLAKNVDTPGPGTFVEKCREAGLTDDILDLFLGDVLTSPPPLWVRRVRNFCESRACSGVSSRQNAATRRAWVDIRSHWTPPGAKVPSAHQRLLSMPEVRDELGVHASDDARILPCESSGWTQACIYVNRLFSPNSSLPGTSSQFGTRSSPVIKRTLL